MEPGAKRGPAILYSALSVLLVVLVAALAFRARQPPPPQVAELTPQAQHQISKAPDQLSASPGSSAGGAGALGTTTTSTTAAAGSGVQSQAVSLPGGVPAAHHCYGNPPRQVAFDTQSPPCVAYWAGDNGGATARGVTATQVNVAVSESGRYANDLQAFFSRTFELYGRQLHFVPVGEGGDCAAEQAQADGLAQQYKPFAAAYIWGGDPCLGAELAHDQVIVAGFQDFLTSQVMRSEAPYLWQYPMAADQQLANMGAFACAHFAGGDAAYSPDPLFQREKRRFGLIFQLPQTPYQVSVSPLTDRLSACGAAPAVTKTYQDTDGNANEEAQKWDASAVDSMAAAGVTTIICMCTTHYNEELGLEETASAQNYYPEWLLGWDNNENSEMQTYWPMAGQAVIGLSTRPAQVPYPDTTLNQALAAVDPGYQVNGSAGTLYSDQQFYWELLLIASGIQMAGPDLTPYTFARGLQLARFPNPLSPEMEGVAGFGAGAYSMTGDEAVMWWSSSAPGPYADEGAGAWCYADGGKRFHLGDWSAPITLFAACDTSPPGS